MPNRSQVIKEYPAEQGIPAAHINQQKNRAQRRSKKRLPGGKVSFPTCTSVKNLKQKVTQKITSGEIPLGTEVVQTAHPRYTTHEGELQQDHTEVYTRKISLLDIREKLPKEA